MAVRSPNLILQQLMKTRCLTHENLAEEVCTAAINLSGVTITCSARTVSRWLSGAVKWPWDRYRRPLEVVFGRSITDLGFVPPPGYSGAKAQDVLPSSTQEPPVLRRTFLLGFQGVLAAPLLPTKGRLGLSDVDTIHAATARLRSLDDRYGGAELVDVATQYVEHIEASARTCSYGSTVQRALHSAIGGLAASVGWFAFDARQQDLARRWWDTALRYAVLAGNSGLQAQVWTCMARQSCELGHGSEAVAIARVALDATRHRRDPRLSALLHSRVALGHSLTGEAGRAGQSLHRADQLLDAFDRVEGEPWLVFMGPAEITWQAAMADYNLGAYRSSVKHAEATLATLPEEFVRNRFDTQVHLARCRLAAGEADAAISAGHHALDLMSGGGVKCPRWERHLARFTHDVQEGAPAGAVEFAERYREVAAS